MAEFVLNGRVAHVAVVHLTSDKSENAVEKRKLQLDQLNAWMSSRKLSLPSFLSLFQSLPLPLFLPDFVGGRDNFIIGDFNFGDDGENVLPVGYDDVWNVLHPGILPFSLLPFPFIFLSSLLFPCSPPAL